MKSRNIVAGWPQGTSSSKPYPKYSAWWIPYLHNWSQVDRTKLVLEQAMEKEYREGQMRMVDEYRKNGAIPNPRTSFKLVGFTDKPTSAGDITAETMASGHAENPLFGRHYYEPLEVHTAPTYGGITRNSVTNAIWNQTPPFTASSIRKAVEAFEFPEDPQVTLWRERILAGWEKYGTGEPLDPKTVEHLAKEFAKPLEWPKVEWKSKDPYA